MMTCELQRENTKFQFRCLDYNGRPILESILFETRDIALNQLNSYLNSPSEKYVYEVCKGNDCHYFKVTKENVVLLESRSFDDKISAYDFVEQLRNGCIVSHIIDRSFGDGDVIYYLSCTSNLQFISPVKIILEKEDDQFIASIPELKIFSFSDEIVTVIEEIKSDLDDLFEDLFVNEHTLSIRAKALKKKFKSKLLLDAIS